MSVDFRDHDIVNRLRAHAVIGLLAAAWMTGLAAPTRAADVDAVLSARETYVGLPVILQIRVVNATDHEPPEIPEVDGLKISSAGTPSRSHRISIINGRRSESSTFTYRYQVSPLREGKFSIPPIGVNVDGRMLRTRESSFIATTSETGDLLFVEISGKRDEVFVGEPLELTLKIWIKPFRDRKLDITLSEGQMWQLLSDQSSWGMFADRLEQLAAENKRPGGEEVLRQDRDGNPRSYYLYELDATVYPQRPGAIDGDEVQVIVNYPTALGKPRSLMDQFFNDNDFPFRRPTAVDEDFISPFASRLRVTSSRPIVAKAAVEPVQVKAIPSAGRPDDYRGAVGRYKIITEAAPTKIKAGDPITLRIGVVGTGRMDLLQAPPLAQLNELTRDFKVPDEPLAGLVDEQRHTKVFSTSIRPRQAGVTRIPAIPFSYFDPAAEKFVTVNSKPIAIEVEPADTLAMDAIVSRQAPRKKPSAPAAEPGNVTSTRADSSFENYAGAELLVDDRMATALTLPMLLTLVAPPILVLAVQLFRVSGQLGQLGDRIRTAHQVCRKRIGTAENAAQLAQALHNFLSRKFRLSDDADGAAAIGKLRMAGHGDLAIRLERILTECQRWELIDGGPRNKSLEQLKLEALEVVAAVQTLRAKPRVRSAGEQTPAGASTARLLCLLVVLWFTVGDSFATAEEPLTVSQQQTLLQEANQAYDRARSAPQLDAADIKQIFSKAASKYQLIVDSGVCNSRLYFNLANALLQSGQTGPAIANYYRALGNDPTNPRFRKNLQYALDVAKPQQQDFTTSIHASAWSWVHRANDQLAAFVHPNWMRTSFALSWVGVWTVLGIRLWSAAGGGFGLPWKTLAVVCLLVATLTGTSYTLSVRPYTAGNLAVVIKPTVALHEADGVQFPTVARWDGAEGGVVQVLQSRSDWLKVQTPAGQTGWLPRESVELVHPSQAGTSSDLTAHPAEISLAPAGN